MSPAGLEGTDPPERRRTVGFALLAAALCVALIGTPLLGLDVFYGGDLVERHAPWDALPPHTEASNPMVGDTVDVSMPARRLFVERVRDGDLPLWQSFANGGRPLGAVPNQALFSPLNAPYLVLPLSYAPGVVKLLELAIGVLALAAWLRGLGVRRSAAVLAGVAYAFNGFQIVYTNFPFAHIGALLPATLWAIDFHLRRRRPATALPLVAVVATMWLEGFPQLTGFALAVGAVWTLARLWHGRDEHAPRAQVAAGGWVLGAVAVATGVAAFQLLPFAADLSHLDLGYRTQTTGDHLALSTLFTLVAPDGLGSPIPPWTWFGPVNYIEVQSFAGVTVTLLAILGVAARRRAGEPRFARPTLVGLAVVPAALTWGGGPLLKAVQWLPLFGQAEIQRVRAVLLLALAALAGLGFDRLADRERPDRRELARLGVTLAAVAVPLALAAAAAADLAAERGTGGVLGDEVTVVAPLAVVAVGVVTVALVRRRGLVLWLLPVLVAVEVVRVAGPFWPRVDHDRFYARTPAHEFLDGRLGHDRTVSAELALYPGTTTWYGVRSAAAHTLPVPAWQQALEAADPGAYERESPTFPRLRSTPAVATSPVLDRLGARYFVTDPAFGVFGEVRGQLGDRPTRLTSTPTEAPLAPADGRVRGVAVRLLEPVAEDAVVTVEVLDGEGRVVADGRRRLTPFDPPGPTAVPVEETDGADGRRVVLAVVHGDEPTVAAGPGGAPAAAPVVAPPRDGLALAHAGGAVIYERRAALPRIRWATSARVVRGGEERLALLGSGRLDDGEVVLSDPPATGTGAAVTGGGSAGTGAGGQAGGAQLEVLDDGGDTVRVGVAADGPGYLVVADSMATDWIATVDGEPAPVVAADHAGAAVAVPDGEHEVVFSYRPSGWTAGVAVTLASLAAVAAVALWDRRRARARPRRD